MDGAASVVIGLLLAGVAVLLVRESRGLLIGEGIRPETAREIRRIATAQPSVRDVGQILSMYIGPQEVLVTLDLHFEDGTRTDEASAAMTLIGAEVRAKFPTIRRLFIEAGEEAT